ncbi:MAG: hypothetical protein KJO77_04875 [Bacteroidia bacterium]|nr:hypothetical protein [Bacteroidia bacterium]NND52118.1 hypothetical protein [Flavobacteriaceae bacterium]
MNYYKILTLLVLGAVMTFYGCKEDGKTNTNTPKQADPQPFKASNTTNNETSQSTASVYHYTCANGCEGGAAAAGNCATCGNPLAHNQAFHNNNNNTNNTQTDSPFLTPAAETSTNTSGVFHYICGQGCAGGAGAAGNCASCGNALTHNAAYHQ